MTSFLSAACITAVNWRQSRGRSGLRRRRQEGRRQMGSDELEPRLVLTAISMTDHEQLMLEFINRARANPAAEATRYGISLNDGLPAGTITTAAKQPLAPHQSLINASRLHSQDMLDQDYFSHTSLSGTSPSGRATTAGYPSTNVGENIAWGGTTGVLNEAAEVPARHESLFRSAGHRQNMLHIPYEEAGVGMRFGVFRSSGTNYNASMVTENFGIRSVNPVITGVVYTDTNDNDFYSIGEAIRAGTITVRNTSTGAEISETIGVSGGYGIIVPSTGTYSVTARYQTGGIQRVAVETVVVGTDNVKVDFETGSVTTVGLTLTRASATIGETGSATTSLLTLTRTADSGSAVTFALSTSDSGETSLPASVTIPAGQLSATFTVTAVNDAIIDGDQISTISAAAAGYPAASVLITTLDTTRPVLPAGPHTSVTPRPALTWSAVSNAASYRVWVDNVSTGASAVIDVAGLTGTSLTPAADLPLGTYRVWVRGVTSGGLAGGWSIPQDWKVATPPAVAGSGNVHNTAGFQLDWSNVPGAATYDVWMDSLTTGTSQYFRNTAVVGNSIVLSDFQIGQYAIWVRGRNSSGDYGSWSARTVQTVSLAPVALRISGGLFSDVPALSWEAVPGAGTYDVWVDNLSTASSMVLRNTSVAATSLAVPELGIGSYRVWVRARDITGANSVWSAPYDFERGRASRVTAPAGTAAGTTPRFTWTAVAGASRYELWVDSRDGLGRVIYFSNLTATTYQPTTDMVAGNYRVWVRAFDTSGASTGWSSYQDFLIASNEPPVTGRPAGIAGTIAADPLPADFSLLDELFAGEVATGEVSSGADDSGSSFEWAVRQQQRCEQTPCVAAEGWKKGRPMINRTAPGGLAVELLQQPAVTLLSADPTSESGRTGADWQSQHGHVRSDLDPLDRPDDRRRDLVGVGI